MNYASVLKKQKDGKKKNSNVEKKRNDDKKKNNNDEKKQNDDKKKNDDDERKNNDARGSGTESEPRNTTNSKYDAPRISLRMPQTSLPRSVYSEGQEVVNKG